MIARFVVLFGVVLAFAAACGGDDSPSPTATPSDSHTPASTAEPTASPDGGGLGTWRTLAPMPTPRTEVAVAAVSFRIYVVGGFEEDGSASDKVEVYDSRVDEWSELAPLPEPRHHAAAAEWSGQLSVFGGFGADHKPTSTVYEYNILNDEWREFSNMGAQHGAGAVVSGDRSSPYVISGLEQGPDGAVVNVAGVETYLVDFWLSVTDIPTPRDHLAAARADGGIYAIGGREQGDFSRNLNVNEAYGIEGEPNTWITRAPMLTARSGIAAASIQDRIYVFGGESPEGTFDENEMYDPETDTWETMAPMPTARHGLGAAVVGDTIYVIGGGPEPGLSVTGANEAYTPPAR